jgi:hypothetical protein
MTAYIYNKNCGKVNSLWCEQRLGYKIHRDMSTYETCTHPPFLHDQRLENKNGKEKKCLLECFEAISHMKVNILKTIYYIFVSTCVYKVYCWRMYGLNV